MTNLMSIINKQLPHEVIVNVFEYYNPYKKHYKTHVLREIEKITLGAWYIYDLRDTIRNFIQNYGLIVERRIFINGIIYGDNTVPTYKDSIWYDYKFIQQNPYK